MVPSLLPPDVSSGNSSGKSSLKTSVIPEFTTPESSCKYTRDEKTYIRELEKIYKLNDESGVPTNVSFLRPHPKRLPDCINLLHQGHQAFHNINPELRRKAFGTDNEISLADYMKVKSEFTNWADPMAKCDFEKIMNDDSLQDVLKNCNICNDGNEHRFVDVMACYSSVKKLDVVKKENLYS